MKMLKHLFFVTLSLALFASCNDDEDNGLENTSRVQVAIKTSTGGASTLKSAEESPLKLEKLYINISEIEFDISDEMEDLLPENDLVYSDIKLKGPFPINLLSEKASTGMVLATTNVPNATYEEIEFEFDVYKGMEKEFEELKGSTIYAAGVFSKNGVDIPFVLKSDEELEIELEYEDEGLVLDGTSSKVFIDLNLDMVLSDLFLSLSTDFDHLVKETDGSILIDKNKNKVILKKFEKAIEEAFEAIEDEHENNN